MRSFRARLADVLPPLLVTAALVLMLAARATAQAPPALGELLAEVPSGDDGTRALRPLVLTRVSWDVEAVGPLASLVLEQEFVNDTSEVLEAAYRFPLPPGAAVALYEMEVGDRLLSGVVRAKAEAREELDRARSEGRRASLLEQHRPDVFSATVTNLAPGDVVVVRLVVALTVERIDGWWSLRLPLTLGHDDGAGGASARSDAERRGDAAGRGDAEGRGRTVEVVVGFPPELLPDEVTSPTHALRDQPSGDGWRRVVVQTDRDSLADRDLVVRYRTKDRRSLVAVSPERGGERDVLLLLDAPDDLEERAHAAVAKELIVVLDTSGSMNDGSLDAARAALHEVVASLRPDERFDIVEYDGDFTRLFGEPREADAFAVSEAHEWLDALRAGGGTRLLPALVDALATPVTGEDRHRVVVVLTDGAMGGDEEILAALADHLGEARLHVVGIGAAPNAHLAREMADVGRGTALFLSPGESVEEGARRLLRRIERPLAWDVDLAWGGAAIGDVHPDPLPDLHAGAPVPVLARLRDESALDLTLTFDTVDGVRIVEEHVALESVVEHPVVSILRARSEIERLEDRLRLLRGGAFDLTAEERDGEIEDARRRLIDVSLESQLVSSETSFIVSESVRNVRPGGPDASVEAAAAAPAAWPATATRRPLRLAVGLMLLGAGTLVLAMDLARRRRSVRAR